MLKFVLDEKMKVEKIEWAPLPYLRPRIAGRNARLGVHGWGGEVPIARITINGITGFGWCTADPVKAAALVGVPVYSMFSEDGMLKEAYRCIEFPLLDWLGQYLDMPVYKIVAKNIKRSDTQGFCVPVYDTSIYFDELDITDDQKAVDMICNEVEYGMKAGHCNFKVKIGRCGMWMDIESGMNRDIDIIQAIRQKIGPDGNLMADANNGYNLNLTKTFLHRTKNTNLYWLEEAFHEDNELYANLKKWMNEENIATLIADGEGYASPVIETWAIKGLIDILQYDLRGYGFFRWMELGHKMDQYGIKSAPHNYGGFYGNYAQLHFASAIDGFALAEWDQATAEGIDASAYHIVDGLIQVPDIKGFGLILDQVRYEYGVKNQGWQFSE